MGAVYRGLEPAEISDYDAALPLGPSELLHGHLSNGLTYYVRPCKKPAQRAAIALAVRVGSVCEEEGERGVAHILEHLAFNATENYSNHEIVSFLEAIGASFGACQNAYTSADETVYQLTVPTGEWRLLERAISVLGEWAGRIRCAPADLAKERGPVLEEWRMGRTGGGRMQEAHWELLLAGSKYASRLPIGLQSVITSCPPDAVRGFYEKWYTPERMAVVVVGDFGDPGRVVECIAAHLGTLGPRPGVPPAAPQPQPPRQPPPELKSKGKGGGGGRGGKPAGSSGGAAACGAVCASCAPAAAAPWAPHSEPRCKAFVDREAQGALVYASFKVPRRPCGTPAEFKRVITDQLFITALNNRLFRASRALDPPFFDAQASDEGLCSAVDAYVLSAAAPDGGTLRALEALLTELARLRLHGLSDGEFRRAAAAIEAQVETTYLERHQCHSEDARDEYVRHFTGGEFVTGQEFEARLYRALLPQITRAEVEAVAARLGPADSAVFKTVEHRRRHSDADVAAVVARVARAEQRGEVARWRQDEVPDSILPSEPEPGGVVFERRLALLQGHELICGNGLRVVLLPRSSLDDELLITALAVGGLSELPPSLLGVGRMAHLLAGELGVYGHRPQALNDALAGKRIDLSLSAGAYTRSLRGSASPVDAAELLQLVHALFTARLEVVEAELHTAVVQLSQSIEAQRRSPTFVFESRLRQMNYGGCYYFEPLTLAEVDKADPHAAVALHSEMFGDPSEFTVVLTGNLGREQALPLVERYLASIPKRPPPPPGPAAAAVAAAAGMLGGGGARGAAAGAGAEGSGGGGGGSGGGAKTDGKRKAGKKSGGGGKRGADDAAAEPPLSPRRSPHRGRDARALTPLPFEFPEAPVVEDVAVDMVSPLSQAQITFPCLLPRPTAVADSIWIDLGCRLLETRLLQRLRFASGKVYAVAASPFFGAESPSREGLLRGEVSIAFSCAPDDREGLVAAALEVVAALQAEGPTAEEVETVRNLERLEWETGQEDNAWWHEHAVAALQGRGMAETGDVDAVFGRMRAAHESVLSALAPEAMRAALQRLLPSPPTRRYTVVTMTPRPPGLLLSAALRARAAWAAASDAAGGEGRAAAAAAVVAVGAAAAVAFAVAAWRRRGAGGGGAGGAA